MTSDRRTGESLVPVPLARLAALGWRILAVVALAIAVIGLTVILSTVAWSIFVAVVIAATFAPYVTTMRERGRSRTAAAGLVTLGALACILLIVVLIALAFLPYLVEIGQRIAAGLTELDNLIGQAWLPASVQAALTGLASAITSEIGSTVASIASAAATVVTIGILAAILTFFLLQDGDRAWVWALGSASTWRKETVTSSGRVALERVGGYLRRSAVQSGIDAIAIFIVLTIIGVPLAGPLAVLVFLGGFIPYFGTILTTAAVLLVTLAASGRQAALVVLVVIVVVKILRRRFVEPRVRGEALDIHPALLLFVLPLGVALGGLVGLFVSVPILAFVLAAGGAILTVLDAEPGRAEPATDDVVPVWLDRLAQWSWRLLVAIGLLAVVVTTAIRIPGVIVPVVIGIIAAATLLPADRWLRRNGWSPARSAIAVTLGAGVVIVAILALTLVSLAGPMSELVQAATKGAQDSSGAAGGTLAGVVAWVESIGEGLVSVVGEATKALIGLAVIVVIAALLTFFFIRDGSTLWARLTRPVSPHRRRHLDQAGDEAVGVLGGYMIGTGVISAFGAATQFLIMAILGVPLALPLAILSFFGGFIPYIGSFITTGLAFLVTVSTGDTTDIIVMGIFTIVFNIVQGNVVAPLVYGRAVNLHPAVVLLAIPAGAALAGVAGMFLVVPFVGVIATTWDSLLQTLDDEPGEGADASGVVAESSVFDARADVEIERPDAVGPQPDG